jgi:hypothetical protein
VTITDIYNSEDIIEIPVRSTNCGHLGVFDLKKFLVLRRNKNYNCPICKRKAVSFYKDEVIDSLIKSNKDNKCLKLKSDYTLINSDTDNIDSTDTVNKFNSLDSSSTFKEKFIDIKSYMNKGKFI